MTHLPLFFRENEAHIHLVTKLVVSSTQKLGYKASYDTLKKHLTLEIPISLQNLKSKWDKYVQKYQGYVLSIFYNLWY